MAKIKIPEINIAPGWKERMAEKTHFSISNILRVSMVAAAIRFILERQYLLAFSTIVILILTFLPALLQRNYRLTIPIEFEFFIVLFIYASLFLGEVNAYYTQFWWWDAMLHTLSGVIIGAIGFMIVYILNSDPRVQIKISPAFVALFALCFAVSIGVVWEIFEFSMDYFFALNMQKSGLVDTMSDLIVDLIGALIVSLIGYFSLKYQKAFFMERGINKFIQNNPQIFRLITTRQKGRIKKHIKRIKEKLKK
jgi:hypothetical protein